MRKFFGFDKAGTLSAAGSFAGGALFSAMINKVNRPKPQEPKDGEDRPKNVRKNTSNSETSVDPQSTLIGPRGNSVPSGSGSGSSGSAGGGKAGGKSAGGDGIGDIVSDIIETASDVAGGTSGMKFNRNAGYGGTFRRGAKGTGSISLGQSDDARRLAQLRQGALPKGINSLKDLAKSRQGRMGDALAAMGYSGYRQLANKAKKLPKSAGRFVRRTGVGAMGAAGLGAIALGAAAVTGDPAKAAALAISAGSAGYNFANFYGDKIAKGAGEAADAGKVAYWGKDLKAVNQYKFDEDFKKNPELMDALTKTLGTRDEARKAINSGDIQAYLNNNLTDKAKVAKAAGLKKKYMAQGMSEGAALERSIAMAKWNRDANPGIFNTMSREQTAFKQNLMKQLEAQGITGSAAKSRVDAILEDLEYFEM